MDMKNFENAYRCAYCKKEYNSPITRANCEQECFRKQEAHRAEAERERLAEERRLERLRNEAEHAALEKELGELVTKLFAHAKKSGMHTFRYVYSHDGGKTIFEFRV